jgi:RimJ/RimL family protein N-acetyltransferase
MRELMDTGETVEAAVRIKLRPATAADSILLDRWRLESSVRRHQPLSDVSVAQLRADLAHQDIEDLYLARGDKFQWIVLADDRPAGWITLVVANWTHGIAEIGYALSTPYQNRGIMPGALRRLIDDLFTNTRLRRLEARCSIENVASYRALEKIGFRREGILRAYFILDDRPIDNYLYSLLRSDVSDGSSG